MPEELLRAATEAVDMLHGFLNSWPWLPTGQAEHGPHPTSTRTLGSPPQPQPSPPTRSRGRSGDGTAPESYFSPIMIPPPEDHPDREHAVRAQDVEHVGQADVEEVLAEVTAPVGPLLGVIGTLALSNVMANRVLPDWAYVPWNCGVAAVVVVIAVKGDGRSFEDLGMSPSAVPAGLRWGLGFSAALLGVYGIGLALPFTRELFLDERADVSGLQLLNKVLVTVPFGTVLLEEVAFRGALPAMFRRRIGHRRRGGLWSDALAAGLFGLWHVLPSWNVNDANPVFRDTLPDGVGQAVAIVGGVVGTAAAGMLFSWMRNRSGSIVAPAALHTTTNSVGYLLAWLSRRLA